MNISTPKNSLFIYRTFMYSLDRRTVAFHIYSMLHSLRKTASLLNIHYSTISKWLKNHERKPYIRDKIKTSSIVESIKLAVEASPFISLTSLQTRIKQSLGIDVSRELVRIAIRNLGLTKKKAKFFSVPKNLAQRTFEFLQARDKAILLKQRVLCIDETSFGRNWQDLKGYSLRGKPLYVQRNVARQTTVSCVACVSEKGWSCVDKVQGSFNSRTFLDFLKKLDLKKSDLLIMDNVSFHHSAIIKDYLKNLNIQVLYTPPYSPWFNPIELCFSIVKRSYVKLQDIDQAFQAVEMRHFQAFFKKSLQCTERF